MGPVRRTTALAANWLGWGLLLVKGRDGVLGEEWHGGESGEGQGPAGPGRYKSQLRQQAREREQRIEAAALRVLVQLGRRAAAEAAAGCAIEDLHGEGLETAEIAAWCGGRPRAA